MNKKTKFILSGLGVLAFLAWHNFTNRNLINEDLGVFVYLLGFILIAIGFQQQTKEKNPKRSHTDQRLDGSKFTKDPRYQGAYWNGKFHGKGRYTYKDGTVYTGTWKYGLPHGQGTQRKPDGKTMAGEWKNGDFLGESASKKVAKKSVSGSNRSKKTSSDFGSRKVAKSKQTASPSSQIKRGVGVEQVDFQEFMIRTMGGGPVRSNMSIYEGFTYICGCGSKHLFSEEKCGVLRELRGMQFVIGCPDKDYLNCVKMTLSKIETQFSTIQTETQTAAETDLSNTTSSLKEKLLELRALVNDGLITEEDYEQAKKQMLDNM
jgi:hypothetical protein